MAAQPGQGHRCDRSPAALPAPTLLLLQDLPPCPLPRKGTSHSALDSCPGPGPAVPLGRKLKLCHFWSLGGEDGRQEATESWQLLLPRLLPPTQGPRPLLGLSLNSLAGTRVPSWPSWSSERVAELFSWESDTGSRQEGTNGFGGPGPMERWPGQLSVLLS